MSELVLLEEERLIIQTDVLRYYGVLASTSRAFLSNKRLVITPKNKWERRIFAKDLEIDIEEIEGTDLERINQIFSIQCKAGTNIRISGSTASILIQHIKTLLDPNHRFIPNQLYQSEVSIERGYGLSTSGLLIIQEEFFILQTYTGLKALFLPKKTHKIPLSKVSKHEFQSVGNKLTIHLEGREISFFGAGAFVSNILLNLRSSEDPLVGNILDVSLHKGSLKIPGVLLVCQKNIYFVPKNIIHRSFGKPYTRISIGKIQYLTFEKQKKPPEIIINAKEKAWTLSCENPSLTQSILAQDISIYLAEQKKRKKNPQQKELLRERIQYNYQNRIQFGYITVTYEDFCFIPETGSDLAMSIPLKKISDIQVTKEHLQISVDKHLFSFRAIESSILEYIVDTIEQCSPPSHLRTPQGNCTLSDISGNSFSAIIKDRNGTSISTPFLKIQVKSDHIRLLLSDFSKEYTPRINTKLSIDIAKPQGRYFFQSRLQSFSRKSSTPIIKAILILNRPTNIFRHNLREDFRIPILQPSHVQRLIHKKKDIKCEQIPNAPTGLSFPLPITINNISSTGCQISLPFSIPMKWIEDGLSVEFSLKILDQEYALTGRSTYSKINPQNPKEIINGLCFDEIDDTLQQQLIEHLQELEHIAIQKHQKTETDDIQKLDSFNPMLRSAMTLTQTPAFSNLSLSEAAHFLSSGQISSFKSGDVLIKEGEEGDSFFVLTSGSVEVRTGETLLAQLEAGAAIGEMALIDPAPRTASIRANTGGTLIEITKDSFEESILFGDQISLKVLQSLSETILDRLVLLNTAIRSELQKGEEASLSNFLEEHSNTGSGS